MIAPPTRHADRIALQPWLLAVTAVATAVCAGVAGGAAVARSTTAQPVGAAGGVALAVVAVLALRSVSVRLAARTVTVLSAAVLMRMGSFGGSLLSGSQGVLAWVVAAVVVFVATDRIGTDAQPALRPTGSTDPNLAVRPAAVTDAGPGPGRADRVGTARAALAAAVGVVLLVLVITPIALPHLSGSTEPGEGPRGEEDRGGTNVLRSTDSLDMTQRPELTDEVVLRVTSDRRTFWRGETFDRWDGRRWTRSEPDRFAVAPDGAVLPAVEDLGAYGDDAFVQRIRVEADYADVVFAAPSAVRVEAEQALAQRSDGTVTTAGQALGRGATYEVESRGPELSEDVLRAAEGEVPAAIRQRYAIEPVLTDRVRDAARSATDGADTTYDRVMALQRWMGERTEYALDAPLSPEGVDVVDHFLFESREGWCEQIASSLVVLARAEGIPARLVTGFVPEDREDLTGTYVVRARNAHAWAEVWFPEVGWVPFDPTADVPLANADQSSPSWGRWLLDHALVIGLVVAAAVLLGGPLLVLLRRWRRRVAERPTTWAGHADARLLALGAAVDRPRADDETATAYARAVAERYGADGLVEVGRVVDDCLFAPESPGPARRGEADRILAEVSAAGAPEPRPAGTRPGGTRRGGRPQ